MYVWLSVCLAVCMSVCMYVCKYVWLSVCLSGCLYVCLYVGLSVWLSVWLSVCLYGCLYVCLSGCLYVSLSGWMSVCLSNYQVPPGIVIIRWQDLAIYLAASFSVLWVLVLDVNRTRQGCRLMTHQPWMESPCQLHLLSMVRISGSYTCTQWYAMCWCVHDTQVFICLWWQAAGPHTRHGSKSTSSGPPEGNQLQTNVQRVSRSDAWGDVCWLPADINRQN